MAALLQIFGCVLKKDNNVGINYFIYTLLIIGLAWLSVASYWFFIEEHVKSFGAFISSIIFFISSAVVKVWGYYLKSKQAKENVLYEVIAKNQPFIEMVGKECINFIRKRGFIAALSAGLIIVTLYKIYGKGNNISKILQKLLEK